MIIIEKIYDAKTEFKRLYKSMRYYSNQQNYTNNKPPLEFYLTHVIDDCIAYWKKIQMPNNTIYKLHRFAIAFRHNVVNNGIH